MASQSYIIEREEALVRAQTAVKELCEAYIGECVRNNSAVAYPENNAVWEATYLNAMELRKELNQLIGKLHPQFNPPKHRPVRVPLDWMNIET